MKEKNILEKIVKSIREADYNSTIELSEILLEYIDDRDKKEEIILFENRYNILKKYLRLGTIDFQEYSIELNKITKNYIDLISTIKLNDNFDKNVIVDIIENSPLERSKRIVNNAKFLFEEFQGGTIRGRGVFSVFSIPDRDLNHPIWQGWNRDEISKASARNERKWLERHIRNNHCRLIIKPQERTDQPIRNKKYMISRLKVLLEFLETYKSKVDIVIMPPNFNFNKRNLLIVGDWFYAESNEPSYRGWRHTEIYSSNVPEKILEFDKEFEEILAFKGFDIFEAKKDAFEQIDYLIYEIENR